MKKRTRGKTKTQVDMSTVIRMLESINFGEAERAAHALGEVADPCAIKPLVSIIKSSSSLRVAAIAALKKFSAENDLAATELAIALMEGTDMDAESHLSAITPADRRRMPRVLLEIPVLVRWKDESGESHSEPSTTRVVNATGALIVLKSPVVAEMELELVNWTTQATVKARVAWVGSASRKGDQQVAIEFSNPAPDFWGCVDVRGG